MEYSPQTERRYIDTFILPLSFGIAESLIVLVLVSGVGMTALCASSMQEYQMPLQFFGCHAVSLPIHFAAPYR